eukprot:515645-Prymnesium_polylepis.1
MRVVIRGASARLAPRCTPTLLSRRACTTAPAAIDEQTYHKLASCTLESIQEVYEDLADDDAELAMEVEYSVRWPISCS